MKVWAKASGIHIQDYCGARMGLDLYDDIRRITGYSKDTTLNTVSNPVWQGVHDDGYVHFSEGWIQIILTFGVPALTESDGANYPAHQYYKPTRILPWCQVWVSPPAQYPADAYDVWFSGFELYRTASPTPNLLPTAIALASAVGAVVYFGVLR